MVKRCRTSDAKELQGEDAFSKVAAAEVDAPADQACRPRLLPRPAAWNGALENGEVSPCGRSEETPREKGVVHPHAHAVSANETADVVQPASYLQHEWQRLSADHAVAPNPISRDRLTRPRAGPFPVDAMSRIDPGHWEDTFTTGGWTRRRSAYGHTIGSSVIEVGHSLHQSMASHFPVIFMRRTQLRLVGSAAATCCQIEWNTASHFEGKCDDWKSTELAYYVTALGFRASHPNWSCALFAGPATPDGDEVVETLDRVTGVLQDSPLQWTIVCPPHLQCVVAYAADAFSLEYATAQSCASGVCGQLMLLAAPPSEVQGRARTADARSWSTFDVTSECLKLPELPDRPILLIYPAAATVAVAAIGMDLWGAIPSHTAGELQLLRDTQAYLRARAARGTPTTLCCAAFGQFYQQHAPFIRRMCQAHRVPEHAIDDCVQEVWLAIICTLDSFDPDVRRGTFRSWLNTVIHHEVVDFHRRMGRRSVQRIDALERPLCSQDQDPAETYEKRRRADVVHETLVRLRHEVSELSYQLVSRRWIAGHYVSDVASALNLSPRDVYDRTYRALRKLRELLEHRDVQPTASCSTGQAGKPRRPEI